MQEHLPGLISYTRRLPSIRSFGVGHKSRSVRIGPLVVFERAIASLAPYRQSDK